MWQERNVLITDESRFILQRADGQTRVHRRRRERNAGVFIVDRDRFDGGSVMVWEGLT